jgi:hypothetical protein
MDFDQPSGRLSDQKILPQLSQDILVMYLLPHCQVIELGLKHQANSDFGDIQ